jgi:hypothetical protein
MDKNTEEASTGKYIGVWILMGILGSVTITVVDQILANALIDPFDPTSGPYWLIAPFIEYLAWAIVFILLYSFFPTIRISKVIPWILALGGLGVLIGLAQIYSSVSGTGISIPAAFPVAMIGSFLGAVFLISSYFSGKHPHRY